MTKLKKLNKGIVLAVVAVLAIVGYYTYQYVDHLDDKRAIKTLSTEFYETIDKYAVTPPDLTKFDSKLSYNDAALKEKEFDSLLDKTFTEDARRSKSFLREGLEDILNRQLDNTLRIHERRTSNIKLEGLKFKDDMAYASISFQINIKLEKLDYGSVKYDEKGNPVYDTITYEGRDYFYASAIFKRTGDGWKIASLEDSSIGHLGYDYSAKHGW